MTQFIRIDQLGHMNHRGKFVPLGLNKEANPKGMEMRLTVSSTAIMKPILQTIYTEQETKPPLRILGLLHRGTDSTKQNRAWEKVVQYQRPHLQKACLHSARWEHFLQLASTTPKTCVAVFGYEFDGENSWYQVWNGQSERSCWVLHHEDMNYRPYAIVAMDALVTLVPQWNGELHAMPHASALADKKNASAINSFDASLAHTLLVSDASADRNGQLWFLVTVTAESIEEQSGGPESANAVSGWIS